MTTEWIECVVCGDDGPRERVEAAIANIERRAVAAERARIRAAVEGLEPLHDRSGPGLYRYGWVEARAAVLAILDREDTE